MYQEKWCTRRRRVLGETEHQERGGSGEGVFQGEEGTGRRSVSREGEP